MKKLILFVAVLGLSFFAYGAYIPAKAILAQYLINDAWNDSIRSGEAHKPWKWADMHPVMKLSSNKHKQELIVLSGDKGNSLAFAPGHNVFSYMHSAFQFCHKLLRIENPKIRQKATLPCHKVSVFFCSSILQLFVLNSLDRVLSTGVLTWRCYSKHPCCQHTCCQI